VIIMKIAIASDHAGFHLKQRVTAFLRERGHDVEDFGTDSDASVDYPDFIVPAARAVANGRCERGIVLGGSGNGEAIAANKIKGVRCTLCWNEDSARLARSHNDANMLSMGARLVSEEKALHIVAIWLDTPFEGGRHIPRVNKLNLLGGA
jgi:ribose 5-phosphate isomerase B